MVNTFLKKVEINSALTILIAGIIAILFWDLKVLMSLIFGGLLGLVNLRWISKTVRGILEANPESPESPESSSGSVSGPIRAKRALLFVYLLKLAVLSLIFITVLKTGRINPPALLAGFTLIITVILFEGIIYAKRV